MKNRFIGEWDYPNRLSCALYNGDSKRALKLINSNSIDAVITDPPYALGLLGNNWDKSLANIKVWKECFRVLKPGAFISVFSSPRSDLLYKSILSLANAGFDVGFTPIYWTYHNGYPKPHHTSKSIEQNAKDSIDLASKYQGSTMGLQLKPSIEHIIIGMKPHGEKSFIKNLIEFEKLPDNIKATCPFIQVPKPNKKEKNLSFSWQSQITINNHPSVKPVKLMSYLIQLFTREGDIVLDPYMGSATSGVSAKLTNRHFIGVEMDVDYFDTCLKRISVPRKDLIEFFKKLK